VSAAPRAWDRIPAMHCKGLCAESCGPIEASTEERALLVERGVNLPSVGQAMTAFFMDGDYTCPALKDERCSVYDVRPTICRLWGAVEGMPCPHGCLPDGGRLPDAIGTALLASLDWPA
jgi:hypothetical protein